MLKVITFIFFISSFSILQANYVKKVNEDFIKYEVNGKYSDILFTIEDELAQNGFIISYRAKIARALKKIDSHYKQNPIFRKAQKIGFCKLSLTLKMMKENTDNLMYCPLNIAFYEKSKEKNKVTIIYRLAKSINSNDKVMKSVNNQILQIIEESIK